MTRRFSVPSLPFQSTLSMRRATHAASSEKHGVQISIHALHEESDDTAAQNVFQHPLFQSTLSMRRATRYAARRTPWASCISIHALHEESDQREFELGCYRFPISIHALHEESDSKRSNSLSPVSTFQSTLSMRRATRCIAMH